MDSEYSVKLETVVFYDYDLDLVKVYTSIVTTKEHILKTLAGGLQDIIIHEATEDGKPVAWEIWIPESYMKSALSLPFTGVALDQRVAKLHQ